MLTKMYENIILEEIINAACIALQHHAYSGE